MSKSPIQWTDHTWNVAAGCTRRTNGCTNCYAFALHDLRHAAYLRSGGVYPKNGKAMPQQYARPFSEVQLLPERLEEPLHIKTPQKIFVCSMSDLFHPQIPDEYIKRVFDVMGAAHWHTFQLLTKCTGRLRRLGAELDWHQNIWCGVSIEEDPLSPRANALRAVGARVRYLSLEPLLSDLPSLDLTGIHWVIVGGESGPHARPMDPQWPRTLRDRCQREGVAFFFKQYGGRTPTSGGRLLDGREWNEFPR